MKDCRFCKGNVEDNKVYKLTQPDGNAIHFCEECAQDMIRHITSGEAERERLESLDASFLSMKELKKTRDNMGNYHGFNQIEGLWPSDISNMFPMTHARLTSVS